MVRLQRSWLLSGRVCLTTAGRAAFETVKVVLNELVVLDCAIESIGRDNIPDSTNLLAQRFVCTEIRLNSNLAE